MAVSTKNEVQNKLAQNKLALIEDYISSVTGLNLSTLDSKSVQILQVIDGKSIVFHDEGIDDVIQRKDAGGRRFLQVNFKNGEKVLITDTLVGFKPVHRDGLDMNRLPKVVTTSDIVSILSALEDALHDETINRNEIETLKKVFEAVVLGGEKVGFNLSQEKKWLGRLTIVSHQSA